MATYQYTPLDAAKKEIRLLNLQPGEFNDPIYITIEHALLESPPASRDERLNFDQLQQSLPPGKSAHETPEGRYFFGDYRYFKKFWEHPNPDFPSVKYAPYDTSRPLATVQYETLSYFWGVEEESANRHVFVRSLGSGTRGRTASRLEVRENLFVALQYLRRKGQPRKLWIDAICINQADLEERAVEVQKMAQIYSMGHRTIIWLGPAVSTTPLAMATINLWASYLMKDIHDLRCYCHPNGPFQEKGEWYPDVEEALRATDSNSLAAVSELLGRPYFYRLWILHEIKLSSKRAIVMCGSETIRWASIVSIVASVQSLDDPLFDTSNVYRVHGIEASTASDTYSLSQTVQRDCQEPHDRVYAVLALLSPELASKIEPNYTVHYDEVYKQLCLDHVQTSEKLDLTFQLFKSTDGNRLSWVPSLWDPDNSAREPTYSAAADSAVVCEYIGPDVLEVMAVVEGTYASVTEPLPIGTWREALDTVSDWYDIGYGHFQKYFGLPRNVYDDVFCDIITQGHCNWKGQGTLPLPSIDEVLKFLNSCR